MVQKAQFGSVWSTDQRGGGLTPVRSFYNNAGNKDNTGLNEENGGRRGKNRMEITGNKDLAIHWKGA